MNVNFRKYHNSPFWDFKKDFKVMRYEISSVTRFEKVVLFFNIFFNFLHKALYQTAPNFRKNSCFFIQIFWLNWTPVVGTSPHDFSQKTTPYSGHKTENMFSKIYQILKVLDAFEKKTANEGTKKCTIT